jgi:predicted dehydrogenase
VKVGFIDHHLHNYHAEVFRRLLVEKIGQGSVELCAAYECAPTSGEDWCATHGVSRAASPEEVVEKSDAILVLAPDNFEAHRPLAQAALASGKPVFVDKVLAETVADSEAMVELAERHGTPIMSSSALRFASELEQLLAGLAGPVESVFSRGFGNWAGYGIHTLAPALRVLGRPVQRVRDTGDAHARLVTLDAGDVRAFIEVRSAENQQEAVPWQVGILSANRYHVATVTRYEEFYENLMRAVLEFFCTRVSPIPVTEMLDSVAVLRGAEESAAKDGAWVDLKQRP